MVSRTSTASGVMPLSLVVFELLPEAPINENADDFVNSENYQDLQNPGYELPIFEWGILK